MLQYNEGGYQIYYTIYGSRLGHPLESLRSYDTEREAIAYAVGFCSRPEIGGFDSIHVKAYGHEDGPYNVWRYFKEEKNV